jgi:predicted nucleotidyltransferase
MSTTPDSNQPNRQETPTFIPRSHHGEVLAANRDAVIALAHEHGMSNVRVFGSTARGSDRPDSDIDLLVDIGPRVSLFTLARLEIALSRLLETDVEVVSARALKPWYANEILVEAAAL